MKRNEELEYISVAETKAKLSEKIKNANRRLRRFAITSHGKPKAVLISYEDYLSLTNKQEVEPKTISISAWKKKRPEDAKIVNAVSSYFKPEELSRKGQKEYKNEFVKGDKKT